MMLVCQVRAFTRRWNIPSACCRSHRPSDCSCRPSPSVIGSCRISTSCNCHQELPPVRPTRVNSINIQLLSEPLYKQIFQRPVTVSGIQRLDNRPRETDKWHTEKHLLSVDKTDQQQSDKQQSKTKFSKVKEHLRIHKLWDRKTGLLADVDFKIPELNGNNIGEHFRSLAEKQIKEYVALAEALQCSQIPEKPSQWQFSAGWTRYEADGTAVPVDFPDDNVLVFDIETLVQEGHYPTLATAVSHKHWYSWCSGNLVSDKYRWSEEVETSDLIPLESTTGSRGAPMINREKRLIIGHNVSFDRSFVKEQYYIKKTNTRFLDTMSLHMAVCGLTSFQRILYKAAKTDSQRKEVREWQKKHAGSFSSDEWKEVGTLNNLSDVYQLHCGGPPLDKSARNVFVEGSTADVRDQFQELMQYCASDVEATCNVFKVLWLEFKDRFPHPVTLAGMMEMGTGYLPVNQNWDRYINQANAVYEDLQRESKQQLMKLASDACEYLHDDRYKQDPWLWNLEWQSKKLRIRNKKVPKSMSKAVDSMEDETETDRVQQVLVLQDLHYKTDMNQDNVGYPQWYVKLCQRIGEDCWEPGAAKISHQTRCTPSLMRLTWDGFPLHWDDGLGWGYLVPGRVDNLRPAAVDDGDASDKAEVQGFPTRALHQLLGVSESKAAMAAMTDDQFEEHMNREVDDDRDIDMEDIHRHWEAHSRGHRKRHLAKAPRSDHIPQHTGDGPYDEVEIPGCWFFKIPHKNGKGFRVGNPLSKDYLNRVEDGTLKSALGEMANRILRLNRTCSYWKMSVKRIESQMKVLLHTSELPDTVTRDRIYNSAERYGAVVPRIVTAGTVTRRAVEATWLTASNAYEDRLGSELKAMVQSPPGYCFVGADVDAQELWIAALLGDSFFAKEHGCTAMGWMALQGTKREGTDLHSKVADTVGISRDHAKVFNYGRIYGAGQKFAVKLLMQFNHRLTEDEAKRKAALMFTTTKGKRNRRTGLWNGGSESAMFNKLEEIARSEQPRTPVLGCRISKALEPETVNDDFMTSRINWVVQSSAVDYLHLMLVCMRWLIDEYEIDARFSISIHDEVRYLVADKDRYRAALALQVTNLLTRSMFSHKLHMDDLPQSVAFFSAVEVDRCLRKEANAECVTPSNPQGLNRGYHIPNGETLTIRKILEKTGGSLEPAKVS